MIAEYLEKGYWTNDVLCDFLDRHTAEMPDREAIVDSKGRYSYRQISEWVNRVALKFLEMDIERGDLVVLQVPECVEYSVVRLACERAGIVSMVEPRTFRHTEMEHVLGRSEAVAVVIPWKFRDFDYFQMIQDIRPKLPQLQHIFVIGEPVPRGSIPLSEILDGPLEERYSFEELGKRKISATEIGYLASTTGTTGLPKLIQQPIATRVSACAQHVKEWNITEDDVVAPFAPLSGAVGMTIGYHSALIAGAKSVMRDHYTGVEDMLGLIQDEKVTLPSVVPAQLARIVDFPEIDKFDIRSLRAIRCGGGYLAPDLAKKAEEKLKCEILIGYGGQDFGSISSVPAGSRAKVRTVTVGRPLPGNILKILDDKGTELPLGEVGEIAVRSVSAPDGYLDDTDANRLTYDEEGFAKTGDLGRLDEDGNLKIVGRKKDIIIRGGQNIYPGEIENLLFTHPKVANVAIVGMPDREMGEKCCVFVVLKADEQFTFEEMRSFLKGKRLASFKFPERLECVSELPLAGGMKIDKKALRIEIENKLKAEGKIQTRWKKHYKNKKAKEELK
jgi:non-ribosomal peptide synthetase component E (peptide arylation enzyme)